MKSLVLSLVFLFSAMFISAQLYIGPKVGAVGSQDVGLGFSGISYDGSYVLRNSRNQYNSVNYGIELMYADGKYYRLKSDISYVKLGSDYSNDSVSYLQTRDYIKANLILGFGFVDHDYQLMLQLGYYYGVLLNRNTMGAIPQTTNIWSIDEYSIVNDNYRNDFGFSIGLSFSLAIGKGWLEFNPRWELGLVSHTTLINKSISSNNVLNTVDFRNNVLSINMAYLIPIMK